MKAAVLATLIPSALGATIYFAGDSTMASGGGGSNTNGEYHPVVNATWRELMKE